MAPLANQWKSPATLDSGIAISACQQWWAELNDPILNDLIQQAVVANPRLQEACHRVCEARARRGVVSGERLPEAKANGSYEYKKVSGNSSPYALTAQDSYSLFSTGFDASWELDLWGKYRRALEAADADFGIAESDRNFVMLTLIGDVAATYVEYRMFQERIAVAHRNVEIQRRTLRLAEERQRAGLAKPLDAAQAAASLHATEARIPSLNIRLQQTENRLCTLLGEVPHDLLARLGTTTPVPMAQDALDLGLPADLLRRRPDVYGAELKVASESARIGVAVADLYPRFSLTGTISVDATDVAGLFSPTSIAHKIGPSISWDVLNFGRTRNRIAAQESRFEQAVWRYQTTVLAAVEEVENALAASANERLRVASLGQAVAAAEESVRLAELYYSQGLASFQSVLDSQRALLNHQNEWIVARGNVALQRIALYKALGGGWAASEQVSHFETTTSPATQDHAVPVFEGQPSFMP